VDGVVITDSDWRTANLLDSVMSRLAGRPMPSAEETLERMINEILVLRAANMEGVTLPMAEAEARVQQTLVGFNLTEPQLLDALASSGLSRRDLTQRMARLILVERALQVLGVRYPDMDGWLAQARADSDIVLYRNGEPTVEATAQVAISPTPDRSTMPNATVTPSAVVVSTPSLTEVPSAAVPQAMAPDFGLEDLAGQTVRLSDLLGKPVLLNFWATWCPPCRAELPALQAAHERYGDAVVILGVDVSETAAQVLQFAPQYGLTYPILLDQDGAVSGSLYGVRGVPTSLVIGADGILSARHVGPLTDADIDRYFAPLIASAPVTPSVTAEPSRASQSQMAPDFTLTSAQGIPVTLSDYRDKASVVLVFYRGQT
jgi:peroxiredoxin